MSLLNNNCNVNNILKEEEKSMDISDDNSRCSTTTSTNITTSVENDNDIIMINNGVLNNANANGVKDSNRKRKKIAPLKRKLTEIIPNDNDKENSPYKTPQTNTNKRRKLTHRSSIHLSQTQTPFLNSNLSQTD